MIRPINSSQGEISFTNPWDPTEGPPRLPEISVRRLSDVLDSPSPRTRPSELNATGISENENDLTDEVSQHWLLRRASPAEASQPSSRRPPLPNDPEGPLRSDRIPSGTGTSGVARAPSFLEPNIFAVSNNQDGRSVQSTSSPLGCSFIDTVLDASPHSTLSSGNLRAVNTRLPPSLPIVPAPSPLPSTSGAPLLTNTPSEEHHENSTGRRNAVSGSSTCVSQELIDTTTRFLPLTDPVTGRRNAFSGPSTESSLPPSSSLSGNPSSTGSPLHGYQRQLMLLEQEKKKRLARQHQEKELQSSRNAEPGSSTGALNPNMPSTPSWQSKKRSLEDCHGSEPQSSPDAGSGSSTCKLDDEMQLKLLEMHYNKARLLNRSPDSLSSRPFAQPSSRLSHRASFPSSPEASSHSPRHNVELGEPSGSPREGLPEYGISRSPESAAHLREARLKLSNESAQSSTTVPSTGPQPTHLPNFSRPFEADAVMEDATPDFVERPPTEDPNVAIGTAVSCSEATDPQNTLPELAPMIHHDLPVRSAPTSMSIRYSHELSLAGSSNRASDPSSFGSFSVPSSSNRASTAPTDASTLYYQTPRESLQRTTDVSEPGAIPTAPRTNNAFAIQEEIVERERAMLSRHANRLRSMASFSALRVLDDVRESSREEDEA